MTMQEIFTKVAKHLLGQNEKAEVPAGCRYRMKIGKRTLRCAIGCLIPDEIYDRKMEGAGIGTLLAFPGMEELFGIGPGGKNDQKKMHVFLYDLQEVHDEAPISQWKKELERQADHYDLEMVGEAK